MYAALCLGLPQEDWRDWAKCGVHESDAGMRISLSCSSDASWTELEILGLKLLEPSRGSSVLHKSHPGISYSLESPQIGVLPAKYSR